MTGWLALALMGCGSEPPKRAGHPSPSSTDPTTQTPAPTPMEALRVLAEADGHHVGQGTMVFPTYEGCCDEGANCFGNNPATPYGTLALPLPPGAEPPAFDLFEPWGPAPAGLYRDTPVREDEAIVFIGRAPPSVRYFGYSSHNSQVRRETSLGKASSPHEGAAASEGSGQRVSCGR